MTTHVTFRTPTTIGGTSIYSRAPRAAETLTESGSSQATTIAAERGEIATVTSTSNIFIAVGSSPTAASGSGDLIPAGTSLEIGRLNASDKIAIITA